MTSIPYASPILTHLDGILLHTPSLVYARMMTTSTGAWEEAPSARGLKSNVIESWKRRRKKEKLQDTGSTGPSGGTTGHSHFGLGNARPRAAGTTAAARPVLPPLLPGQYRPAPGTLAGMPPSMHGYLTGTTGQALPVVPALRSTSSSAPSTRDAPKPPPPSRYYRPA